MRNEKSSSNITEQQKRSIVHRSEKEVNILEVTEAIEIKICAVNHDKINVFTIVR